MPREPRALVVVETELWPEMLHQAGRRGVPTAVINARLSDSSFRSYRRVRPLLRPLLEPLSLVLARSPGRCRTVRRARCAPGEDPHRGQHQIRSRTGPDAAALDRGCPVRRRADDPSSSPVRPWRAKRRWCSTRVTRLEAGGRPVFLILAPRHPERFEAVADLVVRRGLSG